MRSLIFFAIVIGIDIFLKSIKDKKKIEELRRRKTQELQTRKNIRPSTAYETMEVEPKKIISVVDEIKTDDFFGEDKTYLEDHEGYRQRYQKRYDDIRSSYDDIGYDDKNFTDNEHRTHDKNTTQEIKKKEYNKMDNLAFKTSDLKRDVIKGIIFSEVLGKPKSLQKR